MKKLFVLTVLFSLILTSCSTKYDTIENKDVSVKIRSFWGDVDYDSRVCPEQLKPLPELKESGIVPLTELGI